MLLVGINSLSNPLLSAGDDHARRQAPCPAAVEMPSSTSHHRQSRLKGTSEKGKMVVLAAPPPLTPPSDELFCAGVVHQWGCLGCPDFMCFAEYKYRASQMPTASFSHHSFSCPSETAKMRGRETAGCSSGLKLICAQQPLQEPCKRICFCFYLIV